MFKILEKFFGREPSSIRYRNMNNVTTPLMAPIDTPPFRFPVETRPLISTSSPIETHNNLNDNFSKKISQLREILGEEVSIDTLHYLLIKHDTVEKVINTYFDNPS